MLFFLKKKRKKKVEHNKSLQENYFRNASSFLTIPQDPGTLKFPTIS